MKLYVVVASNGRWNAHKVMETAGEIAAEMGVVGSPVWALRIEQQNALANAPVFSGHLPNGAAIAVIGRHISWMVDGKRPSLEPEHITAGKIFVCNVKEQA